jgi:predicted sulfurtransferase
VLRRALLNIVYARRKVGSACTPGVRCEVVLQSEDDGSQEVGDKDKGVLGLGQKQC